MMKLISFLFLVLVTLIKKSSTNSCFGTENIQPIFNRFEEFRDKKAFDPTNPKIPIRQYNYYERHGTKYVTFHIGDTFLSETFEENDKSKEKSIKSGQYRVNNLVTLNYQRTQNGFKFDDWLNKKEFESILQKIDGEIPSDVDEFYKKVLIGMNDMRKKIIDFQKSLSQDDLMRVELFDLHPLDDGFYAQYNENGFGRISVGTTQNNGKTNVSGLVSCNITVQKFRVEDGNVITVGEPYIPVLD